jgi:hypothetical protein
MTEQGFAVRAALWDKLLGTQDPHYDKQLAVPFTDAVDNRRPISADKVSQCPQGG